MGAEAVQSVVAGQYCGDKQLQSVGWSGVTAIFALEINLLSLHP